MACTAPLNNQGLAHELRDRRLNIAGTGRLPAETERNLVKVK